MTFVHDIRLTKEEADFDDSSEARNMWLLQIETMEEANDEGLHKLSCDYDNELEKRYSDGESEEESRTYTSNLSSEPDLQATNLHPKVHQKIHLTALTKRKRDLKKHRRKKQLTKLLKSNMILI